MKKPLFAIALGSMLICSSAASFAQTTFKVFDKILFYDGYATTVTDPVPAGIIRHRNDLYATKLTDAQLASIGTSLSMKVTIKASCDNYDRIGNVNLAFVPKGATTYTPADVKRIEVGRYITPFMNKNAQPDTVPYNYNIDNVAHILKETTLTNIYDVWVELELFGVPYAANTQVAGCSGRNDVFFGTLEFTTNGNTAPQSNNRLMPLSFKADFNNYTAGATDVVGQTVKTINFTVDSNLINTQFYLITSNHGANSGGEEYNRRDHFVYLDNNQILTYKPGRTSCEPFRRYNTQGNGIYGSSVKTDAQWQSFSNWCPGDVIDIRVINLGNLAAGNHSFKISVPDAVFNGGQGNFPLSLYLQGQKEIPSHITEPGQALPLVSTYPNPTNGTATILSDLTVKSVTISNVLGQQVGVSTGKQIDLSAMESGIYWLRIEFTNNEMAISKVFKR